MKCPSCGYESPPGMQFCGMCGTRLTRVCPACNFANPPDFRFCGWCGVPLSVIPQPAETVSPVSPPSPPPVAAPLSLGGERRPATVLMADITGSTDLLEQLGTEAWVELMNRVFHILESEIYRYGGEVNQFRGDGLVAFFGASSAHEDDPERAVLAGLAMQRALAAYTAELSDRGIALRLRVGINTGEVIVTSVGNSRQHSEDTAMGEAVALAARLEAAAEPGTVLVGENTYRLVRSQFEWQPLGTLSLRGISQPVAVYRPIAPVVSTGYAYPPPLIGREAEFQALKECVAGLYSGRGGIVIVMGERGMGKSLLVGQVRQHFVRREVLMAEASAPSPALEWLYGRCRSYGQSSPYSMWIDMLQSWLGVRPAESKEETRQRLRTQAEALWGPRYLEYYPYLVILLSLPFDDDVPEWLVRQAAEWKHQMPFSAEMPWGQHIADEMAILRQHTFLAVRSWVEALARRGPLVLTLEDLHWADTTSLELLEYCLPLCEQEPLLWLALCHPERHSPAWRFRNLVETDYPHRTTVITLAALTEEQSCEFINQLLGPDVLPSEVCSLVISKSEGNPYYLEEIVRSLIEQGKLVRDEELGSWRLAEAVDSLDLPDTLQSLLMARIDRLAPEERRVLQMAAVIGPVFWSSVLEALASSRAFPGDKVIDATTIRACLTALQRAQLIYERGRVPDLGMEYVFKSTLVRDAAYESLLSAQQAAYHLKVAEYLEELAGPETWPRHYSALAYHYRRAGHIRKELFYTIQAAEQARELYANADALRHYTRALELLDQLESQSPAESQRYALLTQRFEVLNGRREVLFMMGDFDAMWADAQALLTLARQLSDDPVWLIDAILQQPGVADLREEEDLEEAVPMAQQALALAQQLGDRYREMQCLIAVARQRFWLNDPSGWDFAQRALELARQLGDRRYEVGILVNLGQLCAPSEPERSVEYLQAALPISRELHDKITELEILNLIGAQLENSDDYYRRLEEHEKMLHLSREIGHRPAEAQALMFCGQIRAIYLGDYEVGLAMLEESRRLREGTAGEVYPLLRIAQVQIVLGRYDEAQAMLELARRLGKSLTQQIGRVGLALVSAMLHNALGGERHLREALELAASQRGAFVDNPQLSRQYQMVAACEASAAHLGLAQRLTDPAQQQMHLEAALEASQEAVDVYSTFGFVRPIECVSEEIFYRHSLALAAAGHHEEAAEYLQRAYSEMMRKWALIPQESHFRRTYLENIPLHRQIQAAYAASPRGAQ
ncbi:MAG: AAA family ATPase [Anaerolineae bacterium]|nr:AAA family ATPase [Anaerolineae bacterium]